MSQTTPPIPLAFCITDLDPGGAERAMVRLVTGLDRSAWSPAVYCLAQRGELADALEREGIPVECFGFGRRSGLSAVFKLKKRLQAQRPALLQTFLFHANIVGRIAGRLARIPKVVCGIRVAERRGRWRLRLDRWTDRLVDRHVCVSQAVAEFSIAAGLPREKLVVIPNGVDFEAYANAKPADLAVLGIPPGSRVIISVARLDPQKGQDVLIEAFRELSAAFADIHLLLVGEGPSRPALEKQAASIAGRVHFCGQRGDVPALLKASTVFVLASRWEGMPNALLEAMAAGCPVVSTAVEGVDELVDHGHTGWIVKGGIPSVSVRDLATEVRAVLTRPLTAAQAAQKSQDIAQKRFTVQSSVRGYADLYAELLGLSSTAEPV